MQQVKKLEQQFSDLEDQLKKLNFNFEVNECNKTIEDIKEKSVTNKTAEDQSNWKLTVSYGPEGTSLQTTIKSLNDISSFLAETYRYFHLSSFPFRTPNYHSESSLQSLSITNPMLQIEYFLHGLIQKNNSRRQITLPSPFTCDAFTRIQLKRQIIHSYFDCIGLNCPIFPKHYFLPYFENNMDEMVVNAMASFFTYTQCQHIYNIPYQKEALAESFRNEAKEQLENVLFEQEPSLFTAATLFFLAQTALIALDNPEARLYMNLAWRMVVKLKPIYIPVQPAEIINAESWKRLFYCIRYLELSLYAIYDGLNDYSSILFDIGIEHPVLLEAEKESVRTRQAVEAFREIVRLQDCQLSQKDDEIKYRLCTGRLEKLFLHDLQRLEIQLCNFWKSLPETFRLSDSPFDYLETERIYQCTNPYALYLNQMYYVQWMALETRLMRSPRAADLQGASMDRYDGERALILVSICTDALSKIVPVLYKILPCSIELHWLLVSADAMGMLKQSKNSQIRARATKNLKATLNVVKHRTRKNLDDRYNLFKSMIPSLVFPGEGSSTSSGSLTGSEPEFYPEDTLESDVKHPPIDYFGVVGKVIDSYLTDDEIPLV